MANRNLNGTRVAILATDGVEQVELIEPRRALDDAGAKTSVVAPREGKIKGWDHDKWGEQITVDVTVQQARSQDFDALLIPGGVMSPDSLRLDGNAVDFVKSFFREGKPVAAICHGPWLLVEANAVHGRTLTSYPSLQTDIRNAGGDWVDREVVTDEGLVTSRNADDIPAFSSKIIEEFAEGIHEGQRMATSRAQSPAEPRAR